MPGRFYLLDVLRGFASLSVVVWHYQHFFFEGPGRLPADFDRGSLPFQQLFAVFYGAGNLAVELFFVLSGFIFFRLYRNAIRDGAVSAREFFVLRFSRLYPLHFATLIFVAICQQLFVYLNGEYVVYPLNDLKHFLLNLLFVSQWGLQDGWSFNAPVWSVSVEVMLYGVFFIVAVRRMDGVAALAVLMIGGLLVIRLTGNSGLGFGVFCFFAGGIACRAFEAVARACRSRRRLQAATLGGVLATAATWILVTRLPFPWSTLLLFGGAFPLLVFTLALLQVNWHRAGAPLRIVGDITYSTYLLHFPLQLTLIGTATALGASLDYRSGVVFAAYFALLILLSIVVYRRFELPLQRYLRQRLGSRKAISEPVTA